MSRIHRKIAGLLLAGLLITAVSLTRPTDAWATCFGVRYDYYSSPSLVEIVGTKISCPGYPDQYDLFAEGQPPVTTPWYTTDTAGCPCPTSGGGGNSDPIDWDSDGH